MECLKIGTVSRVYIIIEFHIERNRIESALKATNGFENVLPNFAEACAGNFFRKLDGVSTSPTKAKEISSFAFLCHH
jgi:hypothetical protein